MFWKLRLALRRRKNALAAIDSPGEALALARLFFIAFVFSMILRLRLSRFLLDRLKNMQPGDAGADHEALLRLTTRTDALLLLGQPLIRSECLSRTCLLYYQMKKVGVDVDMRFGVADSGVDLRYHCWLLVSGEPKYENLDPTTDYKPLYDLSS